MFRTSSSETLYDMKKKVHVLVHEVPEKAANTREKAPNALPLTYTVGQPHDAARVAAQAAD